MSRLLIAAALAVSLLAQRNQAPSAASPAEVTARIVASAQALVATLDAAERAKVQFPFDSAQRTRWSNLPSPMFQREGLRLADLTSAKRRRSCR